MNFHSTGPRTIGVGPIAIVAASLVLSVLFSMPATIVRGQAPEGHCIKAQHHLIDQARDESGEQWKVVARIRSMKGCAKWFLQMEFAPTATHRGSWRWGWAIKAGSSLPDSFTMDASDEAVGKSRAFLGVTTAKTRKIVVKTTQGKKFVIRPKLPSKRLQQQVWLKNVRYFLRFMPMGDQARIAKGYDAAGHLLFQIRGPEGVFEGVS